LSNAIQAVGDVSSFMDGFNSGLGMDLRTSDAAQNEIADGSGLFALNRAGALKLSMVLCCAVSRGLIGTPWGFFVGSDRPDLIGADANGDGTAYPVTTKPGSYGWTLGPSVDIHGAAIVWMRASGSVACRSDADLEGVAEYQGEVYVTDQGREAVRSLTLGLSPPVAQADLVPLQTSPQALVATFLAGPMMDRTIAHHSPESDLNEAPAVSRFMIGVDSGRKGRSEADSRSGGFGQRIDHRKTIDRMFGGWLPEVGRERGEFWSQSELGRWICLPEQARSERTARPSVEESTLPLRSSPENRAGAAVPAEVVFLIDVIFASGPWYGTAWDEQQASAPSRRLPGSY
jgi:hypothetical protein